MRIWRAVRGDSWACGTLPSGNRGLSLEAGPAQSAPPSASTWAGVETWLKVRDWGGGGILEVER